MKKILFATTALIATASVAAADVKIGGYGRFGIDINDANDSDVNGISKSTLTSRLRLQFDMSTETDSGVAFGARFRIQAESRDNTVGAVRQANGARFYASYEGFQVLVGNIIGAIENTPGTYLETRTAGTGIDGAGFVSHVGNVNDEYFNWDSYSSGGSGSNGVELIYSANGFTGHISYSTDNGTPASAGGGFVFDPLTGGSLPVAATAAVPSTDRIAAFVAYTFGDWTVALAAQDSDFAFEDKVIFTVAGDIGQFGVRFAYADNDGLSKFGLYGNMDIGAASNIVLWVTDEEETSAADILAGRTDNSDAANAGVGSEGTSYGIHYSYDLGGGVSFETGYRRASNDNNTFQAGVYFSF